MSRSGGSTFKRCGCRDPRDRAAAGPALPPSARAGARHLVPGGGAVRGAGRAAQASPAGWLRHPRCRAGGTRPAGQTGRPARARRGRLHDRAVAAAPDPPQLPAPPGHLPPAAHRQHPAGDADRRRPARDVHRDRPTAARRRRPAVTGDPGADPRHAAGGAERGDPRRADLRQPGPAG